MACAVTESQDLDLQDFLNTKYVNKNFVYDSKYGSKTKGVVKQVIVSNIIGMDEERGRKLKVRLNSVKHPITDEDFIPIECEPWFGSKIEIKILSTTGILYSLMKDNIYFELNF